MLMKRVPVVQHALNVKHVELRKPSSCESRSGCDFVSAFSVISVY